MGDVVEQGGEELVVGTLPRQLPAPVDGVGGDREEAAGGGPRRHGGVDRLPLRGPTVPWRFRTTGAGVSLS